jgi:hypothetical protein
MTQKCTAEFSVLSSPSKKHFLSFFFQFHSFSSVIFPFIFTQFPMSAVNKLFFSFLENWLPQLTQNGGTGEENGRQKAAATNSQTWRGVKLPW